MIRFEVDPIKKGYQIAIEQEQIAWVQIQLHSIRTSHRGDKRVVWTDRPMSVVWNKFYPFPSYLKSGIYEIVLQDDKGTCLAKRQYYIGDRYEVFFEIKKYEKRWKQLSVSSSFALEANELYFYYNKKKRIPLPALEWNQAIGQYTQHMIFQEREEIKLCDIIVCESLRQHHFLTCKRMRK